MANGQAHTAERGMTTLECALILPLLLMVMLMTVDLCRYFWIDHAVSAAATEGARMAILNEPTDDQVKAWIVTQLGNGGVTDIPVIALSPRVPSQLVTVTVKVPFQYLVVSASIAELAGGTTITATSVMEHEP